MNILLTNDDGFDSIGIRLAKKHLSKIANVTIVAPKTPMSAKSASITLGSNLKLIKEEEDVYSVTGTPADCVALALCVLDKEFDLVVSGCNNGSNHTYDSIYSGTIGAALEALIFRKKAIAISTPYDQFEVVSQGWDMMWKFINENNLISNEYLLNINFPKHSPKNVKLAREYYRKDKDYFEKMSDGEWYALRTLDDLEGVPEDTDCYLVERDTITVVPLNRTYYSEDLYNKLKI